MSQAICQGLVVAESGELEGALGLADLLSDLQGEQAEAFERAQGDSLKLGLEEVTVSLGVAVTIPKEGRGRSVHVLRG